jgi:hypothetical protein
VKSPVFINCPKMSKLISHVSVSNSQERQMVRSKTALLVGFLLAQLVASVGIGCAQTSRSLQDRIPRPDPKKYRSVRNATDWKNPYLIVRPDGIEIVGMIPGRAIAVESVHGVLERLPDSAWPYGLIVALQDVGILSGKTDLPRIEATRTKLLKLLKQLGIAVDRWPSS